MENRNLALNKVLDNLLNERNKISKKIMKFENFNMIPSHTLETRLINLDVRIDEILRAIQD